MTIFSRSTNKSFLGVALAMILAGVIVLVVGAIQGYLMLTSAQSFGWPMAKALGGLIVIALGYIMLQLELIRLRTKN